MSELLLPSSLVEQLAEERAAAMLTQREHPPIVFHGSGSFGLRGLGRQPTAENLLEEGSKGWAAIASRVIADRISGLRMLVSTTRIDSEGNEVTEAQPQNPLQLLLDKPGPIFTRDLLLYLTAYHVLNAGVAYWQKLRDGIGTPVQLWPMPPQSVTPIPMDGLPIGAFRVRSGDGRESTLPLSDVVMLWKPDPSTLYTAMGRLGPQSTEWDMLRFMGEHLRSHFEHDATPHVAIIAGAEATAPDPDEQQAFVDRWRQAYHSRRGEDRGVPAFVPAGFDVHEFSGPESGKAALVPIDQHYGSQILSAYGVSPFSVGRDTNVNRATAEAALWGQDRNAVLPLTRLIEGAINAQLSPEFDSSLEVAFEEFVAPDKEFDLKQEAQDLTTKVRTVQQVLRDRGVADPEAEAPWGVDPVGAFTDVPYTGESADLGSDGESAGDLEAEDHSGDTRGGPPRLTSRDIIEGFHAIAPRGKTIDPEIVWKRQVAFEKKFVIRFERAMDSIFSTQRKSILVKLRKQGAPRDDVSYHGIVLQVGMGANDWPEHERGPADVLFSVAEWVALFKERFEKLRQTAFEESAAAGATDVGGTFQLSQRASKIIEAQGQQMRAKVNATTRALLNRTLAQGIAEGDSIDGLVKRINAVMRNRKRSRTIARTELLKANQAGQIEGFHQGGVEEKQWNTQRDGTVRDSHQIDGQRVALSDPFELSDGHLAQHPGDGSLPADDVINCRCFSTPVVG